MIKDRQNVDRSKRSFGFFVKETTEDVLNKVFGHSANNVIDIIEKNYLSFDNISEKGQIFLEALDQILGKGGVIIQDLIIENLYANLGLEFRPVSDYRFTDYLEDLKKQCSNSKVLR